MQTLSITVYTFDELSDKAKETARTWYREALFSDTQWADSVIEDAREVADMLGVRFDQREVRTLGGKTIYEPAVWWSASSCQGDGASFDGIYRYTKGAAQKVRRERPQDTALHVIADKLQQTQARYGYSLYARCKLTGAHYVHSGCMSVDVESSRDMEVRADAETELRLSMRAFADWIYKQLLQESEYQSSNENVDDSIRANEYTFHDDGARVMRER